MSALIGKSGSLDLAARNNTFELTFDYVETYYDEAEKNYSILDYTINLRNKFSQFAGTNNCVITGNFYCLSNGSTKTITINKTVTLPNSLSSTVEVASGSLELIHKKDGSGYFYLKSGNSRILIKIMVQYIHSLQIITTDAIELTKNIYQGPFYVKTKSYTLGDTVYPEVESGPYYYTDYCLINQTDYITYVSDKKYVYLNPYYGDAETIELTKVATKYSSSISIAETGMGIDFVPASSSKSKYEDNTINISFDSTENCHDYTITYNFSEDYTYPKKMLSSYTYVIGGITRKTSYWSNVKGLSSFYDDLEKCKKDIKDYYSSDDSYKFYPLSVSYSTFSSTETFLYEVIQPIYRFILDDEIIGWVGNSDFYNNDYITIKNSCSGIIESDEDRLKDLMFHGSHYVDCIKCTTDNTIVISNSDTTTEGATEYTPPESYSNISSQYIYYDSDTKRNRFQNLVSDIVFVTEYKEYSYKVKFYFNNEYSITVPFSTSFKNNSYTSPSDTSIGIKLNPQFYELLQYSDDYSSNPYENYYELDIYSNSYEFYIDTKNNSVSPTYTKLDVLISKAKLSENSDMIITNLLELDLSNENQRNYFTYDSLTDAHILNLNAIYTRKYLPELSFNNVYYFRSQTVMTDSKIRNLKTKILNGTINKNLYSTGKHVFGILEYKYGVPDNDYTGDKYKMYFGDEIMYCLPNSSNNYTIKDGFYYLSDNNELTYCLPTISIKQIDIDTDVLTGTCICETFIDKYEDTLYLMFSTSEETWDEYADIKLNVLNYHFKNGYDDSKDLIMQEYENLIDDFYTAIKNDTSTEIILKSVSNVLIDISKNVDAIAIGGELETSDSKIVKVNYDIKLGNKNSYQYTVGMLNASTSDVIEIVYDITDLGVGRYYVVNSYFGNNTVPQNLNYICIDNGKSFSSTDSNYISISINQGAVVDIRLNVTSVASGSDSGGTYTLHTYYLNIYDGSNIYLNKEIISKTYL